MFENLHSVFKETIKLAEEKERLDNELTDETKDLSVENYIVYLQKDTPICLRAFDAQNNLVDFLMKQDYETIKTLLVIMYLGRDNAFANISIPEKRFKALREAFNCFDDKETDMYHLIEKTPLPIYLESGLKILKINI